MLTSLNDKTRNLEATNSQQVPYNKETSSYIVLKIKSGFMQWEIFKQILIAHHEVKTKCSTMNT